MTEAVGVVPLDGSGTSERVLPWTAPVARALGLRLVLLRFVQEGSLEAGDDLPAAVQSAQRYVDGVAGPLRAAGLTAEGRAASCGLDVAGAIAALARESSAALILLSTHGYSGFDRWALGSVADAVIRTAPCPVFVVNEDPTTLPKANRAIHRVLAPLDEFALGEAALSQAVRLAAASNAVLDLLHVIPEPWALAADLFKRIGNSMRTTAQIYLSQVRARLPASLTVEEHVLDGSPATMIVEHAERTNADVIVMSTRSRSGITRWALGSVADRVVRAGGRPVMLVHPSGPLAGQGISLAETHGTAPNGDER
jgi:nucleotide-binding universal stress UspA family protein